MGLGSDVGSPVSPVFTPLRGELVLDDDDYEDFDHHLNDERKKMSEKKRVASNDVELKQEETKEQPN